MSGANVTVTIGAAFAGSFKSVFREADRELKNFGKRATKSMKSFGRESERAAKHVSTMGAAAKDMNVYATSGRKAAKSVKAISAATVKMSKAQIRAAKATGVANGNASAIMGLPSKGMLRDAERTIRRYRKLMKPVALNDVRDVATEMPKAFERAVKDSVKAVTKGSRQMRRAMNGNIGSAVDAMPGGFRRASRNLPGVTRAVRPSRRAVNSDTPSIRSGMPAGFERAVRRQSRSTKVRPPRKAANVNLTADHVSMPAGFGKAVRGLPGVSMGGKPPKAANAASLPGAAANSMHTPHTPSVPPRATPSGVPAIGARGLPVSPWGGQPPAPPPGGGRGGRGGGRGGRRTPPHGGAVPGNPTGYHNAPHQHRSNIHSHDGQAIVGGIGAAVSAHTIWDAVKSAGEMNDLQVLLKLQGRNATEIQDATNAARRIAAQYPNISSIDAMKSIIDVADTGDRDMKKAARLAPLMARAAKAVSIISEGDGEAKGRLGEGQSRFMGRAIEDLGYGTKSEGEIKDLVDQVVGGTIATRGIFNPRELFQVIQKSGGMARGWSKEYMGQVLPAIVMAMGGSGAGDASYMFQKLLTKGQGQLSSAKAMMELGLINHRDLMYDGSKFLQVRPDAMPQADLLRQNPYEWFKGVMMPAAMRKSGIKDVAATRKDFETKHAGDADLAGLDDAAKKAKLNDKFVTFLADTLQKHVDTFAKAKNTAKMFADLIAQQEQIDAQVAQIKKQPKNAIDVMMDEGFTAQVDKIKNSFHSLMAAMGAPEVGDAVAAMDKIATAMSKVAFAASADPETTQKVMAAFGAITAGFAAVSLAGITATVLTAAGPFGLAVGAIAAGLAAWAALDWDGFSESMETLLSVAKTIGSIISYLDNIGNDKDGNSLIGRAVSAMLGNREEDFSEQARTKAFNDVQTAKKKLSDFDAGTTGMNPKYRSRLENDVTHAEANLKAKDDAIIKHEDRKRRKEERAAKATKALEDSERKLKEMQDKQEGAQRLKDHIEHSDHAQTEANEKFKPKEQFAEIARKRKKRRPGQSEWVPQDGDEKPKGTTGKPIWVGPGSKTYDQGGVPLSAENVVPVAPTHGAKPMPGPAPGPTPGGALGAGGKITVDLAGPVSIKDEVGVKQPLRLVTPVLVTAQGILNVHDAELQGTMAGLAATLSTIAGHTASLPAIAASCAAIAAKDFSPKITVNAGSAGSSGASRERSSLSD